MSVELAEEVKIFLVEAHENLDTAESDLVKLESSPKDNELINSVFRAVHTIKGNAGFLAFQDLEAVCHTTETALDSLRKGESEFTPQLASELLENVDVIRKKLQVIESTGSE